MCRVKIWKDQDLAGVSGFPRTRSLLPLEDNNGEDSLWMAFKQYPPP